jgi:hypothetical protein
MERCLLLSVTSIGFTACCQLHSWTKIARYVRSGDRRSGRASCCNSSMQAVSSALYIAMTEIQRDVSCVPVCRFCQVFFHHLTPRNRYALIEQLRQPLPPGSPSGPSSGPSNRPTSPSPAPPRPRSLGNSGRHISRSGGGLFQSLFGRSTSGSRTASGSSSQSRNSNSGGAHRGGMSNEPRGSTPFSWALGR